MHLRVLRVRWRRQVKLPWSWCCGTGTQSACRGFCVYFTISIIYATCGKPLSLTLECALAPDPRRIADSMVQEIAQMGVVRVFVARGIGSVFGFKSEGMGILKRRI